MLLHYWYTGWPDHNLPKNPNALVELIKQVELDRKYGDGQCKGPALVHCSAGVGRTGCFLALAIGIRQLDSHNLVDILKIVANLRIERFKFSISLNLFVASKLIWICNLFKGRHDSDT